MSYLETKNTKLRKSRINFCGLQLCFDHKRGCLPEVAISFFTIVIEPIASYLMCLLFNQP